MARTARKTAQIFGSTAAANQIAKFGSLAAGSPTFSTDVATIQSLSQWLSGWFSAVIGGNSPAIEDMNAFCYVMAYQIFYMLQVGIPEYDSASTYFTGDVVQDGAGVSYISQADNNTGNALTVNTKWSTMPLSTKGSSYGASTTIASGMAQTYGQMTIAAAATWTIASGGFLNVVSQLIVSGTLVANGIVRVI